MAHLGSFKTQSTATKNLPCFLLLLLLLFCFFVFLSGWDTPSCIQDLLLTYDQIHSQQVNSHLAHWETQCGAGDITQMGHMQGNHLTCYISSFDNLPSELKLIMIKQFYFIIVKLSEV